MSNAETALRKKADDSGMPYNALLMVYKRGIGAWKTNPQSVRLEATGVKNYSASRAGKMGKEQWAQARVNAFIEKRPTVYTGADDDIRKMFGLPR
jgi:hypothetical protein